MKVFWGNQDKKTFYLDSYFYVIENCCSIVAVNQEFGKQLLGGKRVIIALRWGLEYNL